MNNIPKKLRAKMAADPFYKVCAVTGDRGTRADPVQWHHNLIFGGSQVQEAFCILPIKRSIHDQANNKAVRARLDWIMLSRATQDELTRFSKAVDMRFKLTSLRELFGTWESSVPEEAINY